MKKIKKHKIKIILLASIILVLAIGVKNTLALLSDKKELTNTFVDPIAELYIEETFAYGVKSDVFVSNFSDIPMYIRVAIVPTYSNGTEIHSKKPISNLENNEDYDFILNLNNEDWIMGSDGYYYYRYPVKPFDSTINLINESYEVEGNAPEGYGLNIDIIASGVQAEPYDAVKEKWNSSVTDVSESGELIVQ